MADNKFLKVMKDAATDRGLELVTGNNHPPVPVGWASLASGFDDELVTVEVSFNTAVGDDSEYWTADIYEGDEDSSRLAHATFGNDTASLFRLLGTWLG